MSTPTPQTVFDQVVEQIYQAFKRNEPVSQFEVRRWKKSVADLQKIDAAAALMLKGALCALECDFSGMNECLANAVHLGRGESLVYRNFAVSFGNFGAHDVAFQLLRHALEVSPNSPDLLGMAVDAAYRSGRLEEAIRMTDVWALRDKDFSGRTRDKAERVKLFLDRYGVPDSELLESHRAMVEIMARHKVRQAGNTYRFVDDGYMESVTRVVFLNADLDLVHELNQELDSALAERLVDAHPWAFVAVFEGLRANEHHS